jgi:prophage maintenance system killer protein
MSPNINHGFVLLHPHILQAIQAEFVTRHGGRVGLRAQSPIKILHARAQLLADDPSPDIIKLAAHYGHGIASDPLFEDGSAAVAFVAVETFLQINHHRLRADDTICFLGFSVLANGGLSYDRFYDWLKERVTPSPKSARLSVA